MDKISSLAQVAARRMSFIGGGALAHEGAAPNEALTGGSPADFPQTGRPRIPKRVYIMVAVLVLGFTGMNVVSFSADTSAGSLLKAWLPAAVLLTILFVLLWFIIRKGTTTDAPDRITTKYLFNRERTMKHADIASYRFADGWGQTSIILHSVDDHMMVVNLRNYRLPRLFLYLAVRAAVLKDRPAFDRDLRRLSRHFRINPSDQDYAYLRQINAEIHD